MDRTEITYRFERLRALASGILETAFTTFLLLIAVQWFGFGATAKAGIAAAGALGFMLGPVVVSRVTELGWTTAQAASRLALGAACCFGLLAVVNDQWLFIGGVIVATTLATAVIPLVTQIYQENYPTRRRGKYFSRTAMIRITSAAVFGLFAGWILTNGNGTGKLDGYPHWLMLIFAGSFAWASFCFSRLPARPLTGTKGTHPFRSLRFVKEDKLFRHILICWMLFGIGNLMLFPLRVEYLANANEYAGDYQLTFNPTPARIALILVFIPNIVKLVCSPFWGNLFDRMNFIVLRMILNVLFGIGIALFFISKNLLVIGTGSALIGLAFAGGSIAWALWVTKYAPSGKVSAYMSVHVCLTGIRGTIGPIIGYWTAAQVGASMTGWVSCGLMILATVMLIPEIKHGRNKMVVTS